MHPVIRAISLVVISTLLAAACTVAPSPVPIPSPATTALRAYFFLGSFTGNAGLAPVERRVPRLEPVGAMERAAVEALIAGPNDAELGASPAMYTTIATETRLLDLRFDAGVATVNLSGAFDSGGGLLVARSRFAQVVYTLTQFPTISAVSFEIDGRPETDLSAGAPLDRSTFTDLLPAIFVDTPAWGSGVASPIRITGLADVFEATFHVRILDAGSHSLADGPVMASCGSGCRGTFDASVPYTIAAASAGTLQVYELSAADGSIVNLTEYPTTLTP
jgi:hypothetical protein